MLACSERTTADDSDDEKNDEEEEDEEEGEEEKEEGEEEIFSDGATVSKIQVWLFITCRAQLFKLWRQYLQSIRILKNMYWPYQ